MSIQDNYRPPDADLGHGDEAVDTAQRLHNEQNGLAAVLAAWVASVVIAVAWGYSNLLHPAMPSLFLALSGFVIGLAVRFAGRGITARFRVVAVIFHWFTTFAVIIFFGIPFMAYSPVVVLFGIFVAGSVAAATVARRSLSPDEASVAWKIRYEARQPEARLRNSAWAMAAAGLVVVVVGFLVLALVSIRVVT